MIKLTNQRAIALGLGLVSMVAFGACDNGGGGGGTGIAGIDKFNRPGPERVTTQRVGQCTRFLPPQGPQGSRIGLGWANGTGGTPNTYSGILTRAASFGTVVTAANTTNSGTGREVDTCIDQLAQARSDASGRFATAGHSQGGSGCINAARLNNRVITTCPVQLDGIFTAQSNPRDIKGSAQSPAFITCGSADTLAPCGSPNNGNTKFNQAGVPIAQTTVSGASHFAPTGGGGLFAALVTACVRASVDDEARRAISPGGLNGARGLQGSRTRGF